MEPNYAKLPRDLGPGLVSCVCRRTETVLRGSSLVVCDHWERNREEGIQMERRDIDDAAHLERIYCLDTSIL